MVDRKTDIVIFTLSRWDSPISSPSLALAKEFSKNNRVFYIDHPYSFKDFFALYSKDEIQSRKRALIKRESIFKEVKGEDYSFIAATPPITLPINFLPKGRLYNILADYNDKRIFDTLRKLIKQYNIKSFIFINAYDPFFARNFPSDIKPLVKVYQSMDDISQEEYTKKHGVQLEIQMIQSYDITLSTSRELERIKSEYSRNVYYHPNAADLDLFKKAVEEKLEKPRELKSISKPIIGYTGQIGSRINFQLLKKITEYHSDKIICMVGPIGDEEYKQINLNKIDNVILTGPKRIDDLPHYLQFMDCAIIPFKCNVLTKSIYPLKINEYLAAGKPVVATHFSEDISSFKDVIYLSEDDDSFLSNIDKAIRENGDEKINSRIGKAQQNTWKARVESFWDILDDYFNRIS